MANNPVSRRFLAIVASTAVLITLSGAPGGLIGQAAPSAEDRAAIVHVLNRAAFGPRPGDVDRISRIGLDHYLKDQLQPDRIDDASLEARLQSFETLNMSSSELVAKYFGPAMEIRRDQDARAARAAARGQSQGTMAGDNAMTPAAPAAPNPQLLSPEAQRAQLAQRTVVNELMQARMLRAVESERQLQEVLTDFWFNHFNVFIGKGQVRQYLTEYERDVIRPNVLGSFRDAARQGRAQPGDALLPRQLAERVAESPAATQRGPRAPLEQFAADARAASAAHRAAAADGGASCRDRTAASTRTTRAS